MTFHMNLGGMSLSMGEVKNLTYGGSTTININGRVVESTAAKTPREVLPMARKHHEDLQGLHTRCKTDAHRVVLRDAIARSTDLFERIRVDGPMADACTGAHGMARILEETRAALSHPRTSSKREHRESKHDTRTPSTTTTKTSSTITVSTTMEILTAAGRVRVDHGRAEPSRTPVAATRVIDDQTRADIPPRQPMGALALERSMRGLVIDASGVRTSASESSPARR